jgi:hypothetical protein
MSFVYLHADEDKQEILALLSLTMSKIAAQYFAASNWKKKEKPQRVYCRGFEGRKKREK